MPTSKLTLSKTPEEDYLDLLIAGYDENLTQDSFTILAIQGYNHKVYNTMVTLNIDDKKISFLHRRTPLTELLSYFNTQSTLTVSLLDYLDTPIEKLLIDYLRQVVRYNIFTDLNINLVYKNASSALLEVSVIDSHLTVTGKHRFTITPDDSTKLLKSVVNQELVGFTYKDLNSPNLIPLEI